MESIQTTFKASPLFKSDASRILSGLVDIYPSKALIIGEAITFPEEIVEDPNASLVYKEKVYKNTSILASTDISFVDQVWTQSHGTDVIVHISSSDLRKPLLDKVLSTEKSIVKEYEKIPPETIVPIQYILLTYDLKIGNRTIYDLPMGLLQVDKVDMKIGQQSYESESQSLTIHTVLKVGTQGGLEVQVKGCLGNLANIMRGLGTMIETFEKSIAESQKSALISKSELTKALHAQNANVPYIKDGYWMINGRQVAKVEAPASTGGASTDEYENEYKALSSLVNEKSNRIFEEITELKRQVDEYRDIIKWLLHTQFALTKDGNSIFAYRLKYPNMDSKWNYEGNVEPIWLKMSPDGGKAGDIWSLENEKRWNKQKLFDVFGGDTDVHITYDANRGTIS